MQYTMSFVIFIISSCDLAGSERIKKTNAEGERLSEAQYINFSLLELGSVVEKSFCCFCKISNLDMRFFWS